MYKTDIGIDSQGTRTHTQIRGRDEIDEGEEEKSKGKRSVHYAYASARDPFR